MSYRRKKKKKIITSNPPFASHESKSSGIQRRLFLPSPFSAVRQKEQGLKKSQNTPLYACPIPKRNKCCKQNTGESHRRRGAGGGVMGKGYELV
jgi:hypothetical protein